MKNARSLHEHRHRSFNCISRVGFAESLTEKRRNPVRNCSERSVAQREHYATS